MPRGKPLEVGMTYGQIKILSVYSEKKQHQNKLFNIQCLKCQNIAQYSGQEILRYQASGCRQCRSKEADARREENYKTYIGSTFGNLKVIGYAGKKQVAKNCSYQKPYMLCECQKCGNISEIPLAGLKRGIEICQKCAKQNLKVGYEIRKMSNVGGTMVTAIDGRRNLNRNSTTYHTGVSWIPKIQKYRAYINFRRKQYHLGVFSKLDDAVAVRKEAEKQIYGDFIKWYSETYPENWKIIQNSRKEEKNE